MLVKRKGCLLRDRNKRLKKKSYRQKKGVSLLLKRMAEISEDSLVAICVLFVSRDLLPPYSEACQFYTCERDSGESRKWWVRKNSWSSSSMHSLHAIHNQGIGGLTFGVDSNPQSILNPLVSLAKSPREYISSPHPQSPFFSYQLLWEMFGFIPPKGCIWRILDL